MKNIALVRKSDLRDGRTVTVGCMDITNSFEQTLKAGVPYMLAPMFDRATGRLLYARIEEQNEEPLSDKDFDSAMAAWEKDLEEDALIWIRYRVRAITLEEAHAQRDALHEKRRTKIREEERAKAKAELIEFMESL